MWVSSGGVIGKQFLTCSCLHVEHTVLPLASHTHIVPIHGYVDWLMSGEFSQEGDAILMQ